LYVYIYNNYYVYIITYIYVYIYIYEILSDIIEGILSGIYSGTAGATEIWSSRLRSEPTLIKSRDPNLAGGETTYYQQSANGGLINRKMII